MLEAENQRSSYTILYVTATNLPSFPVDLLKKYTLLKDFCRLRNIFLAHGYYPGIHTTIRK